jgi:hypothetical protein
MNLSSVHQIEDYLGIEPVHFEVSFAVSPPGREAKRYPACSTVRENIWAEVVNGWIDSGRINCLRCLELAFRENYIDLKTFSRRYKEAR